MSEGYIYIARNEQYPPNIYKIGETALSPEERAKSLSSQTGVFGVFNIVHSVKVSDIKAEKEIHSLLNKYRSTPNKEFFNISLKEAIKVVNDVAARFSPLPKIHSNKYFMIIEDKYHFHESIVSLAFSPNKNFLVGRGEGRMITWDMISGDKVIDEYSKSSTNDNILSFGSSGKMFLSIIKR